MVYLPFSFEADWILPKELSLNYAWIDFKWEELHKNQPH